MILNLTPVLLTVPLISAAPIKPPKGVEWDFPGMNIITGPAGSPINIGVDCRDEFALCHEICHVYQQNSSALSQCYDDCAVSDPADRCEAAASAMTSPGAETGSGGAEPSTGTGSG
ncbi:hypothetical protein BDW62DRAFT_201765 [Aspergillus aurantiobrunneus]